MSTRNSRNIIAALMIILGTLMVVSSPLSAADGDPSCVNVVVDFDDTNPTPLFSGNTSVGPVALSLAAGTYDILLTSTDLTHGPGLFVDQLHESWYFTLDNGFVSAVTPDIAEDSTGTAIVQAAVSLTAATQITAIWAGELPSFDSVHAMVSFTCARATIPTTTTAATTTAAPTTTALPATTAASTTTQAPTTIAATTSQPLTPTTLTPTTGASVTTTTEGVGEIGGTSEENEELAFTGTNLNLAIGGLLLIAGGFGLVVIGSIYDRRKLAYVRS